MTKQEIINRIVDKTMIDSFLLIGMILSLSISLLCDCYVDITLSYFST